MRRIGLVLASAIAVLGLVTVVFRSTAASHARAAAVLASTLEVPGAEWMLARVTADPRIEERRIGGVATTVARPDSVSAGPTLVFLNGATPLGRRHPAVRRLARSLARLGITVYVPDPHGLAAGEITTATVDDSVAVARRAVEESAAGDTTLAGISVGATLALLVAADEELAPRIRLVAGLAPYGDVVEVFRLATTGWYRHDRVLRPYPPDPFLGLVVARSLLAGLDPSDERDRLLERMRRVRSSAPEPLSALAAVDRAELPRDVAAALALLANRDPERFDELYAGLPSAVRTRMERLSPVLQVSELGAPVELASGPQDKYFPLWESEALVRFAEGGRLTVARLLGHTGPTIWRFDPVGIVRFHVYLVRTLDVAAER